VIAVDTNILVYAHREDSSFHAAAIEAVTGLAEGRASWAIPWPCIHEFLAIVTHPRLYSPPTPIAKARAWPRYASRTACASCGPPIATFPAFAV
jgi:uncharacterized protein